MPKEKAGWLGCCPDYREAAGPSDRVAGTCSPLWQLALSVFVLEIHLQSFVLCYSSGSDHHML